MGNVTMRDIGKKVGVSAVTVSKALAGKSGVSEEMRQRIVDIAMLWKSTAQMQSVGISISTPHLGCPTVSMAMQ